MRGAVQRRPLREEHYSLRRSKIIYQVRTRFDIEPEEGDDLGPKLIANLVVHCLPARAALREAQVVQRSRPLRWALGVLSSGITSAR